jgi:signal peptidase I
VRNFTRELIGTLVIAMAIFLLVRLVVGSYTVTSQSMEPGLQIGQWIVINKLAYKTNHPSRGDIIFYKTPDGDLNQLKRIIGLPGDIVDIHGKAVYLNGRQLKEPYIASQSDYTVEEFQIPPDNFFIMGDNRNNSNDSSTGWTLPAKNILGKAWIITWPPDEWGGAGNYNLDSQISASE